MRLQCTATLEATMDHELYADSAQARALDRRMSSDDDLHWSQGITPEEAAENNRAWLERLRIQNESRAASAKKVRLAALAKMEAMCGRSAAARGI
jgi:hypothetical protein